MELSVKVKPEITRTESEDPNLKKKTFVYIKKNPQFFRTGGSIPDLGGCITSYSTHLKCPARWGRPGEVFKLVWEVLKRGSIFYRAGHATTLPRQCDHVLRQKKLLIIALRLYSLRSFHLDTKVLTFFDFFLALNFSRCRCREAKILSRDNRATILLYPNDCSSVGWRHGRGSYPEGWRQARVRAQQAGGLQGELCPAYVCSKECLCEKGSLSEGATPPSGSPLWEILTRFSTIWILLPFSEI